MSIGGRMSVFGADKMRAKKDVVVELVKFLCNMGGRVDFCDTFIIRLCDMGSEDAQDRYDKHRDRETL